MDGLFLSGRLLRLVPSEPTVKKDGTAGATYPALLVLVGGEAQKVEYPTLDALHAALPAKVPAPEADGVYPSLPQVSLPVRAIGSWDARIGRFGEVRFGPARS